MDATTPITETEFIAFDLETTGLHPVSSQIVEVGAVRFRGDGEVLAQFQQLVDPQTQIPPAATRVNGLTHAMLKGQPTIAEVLPQFLEFLGSAPVVMLAHNASFDMGFLSFALTRLRYPVPTHQTFDTCTLARRRVSLSGHNLQTLGRHFELIDVERHRALEDAVLLKDVFARLIAQPPALRLVEDICTICPPRTWEEFTTTLKHPPKGFEELWKAMASGAPVEIRYAGGGQPGRPRRVTPQSVVEMRGTLYLTAFCHQGRCDKTFRLDRIQSYAVVPSK